MISSRMVARDDVTARRRCRRVLLSLVIGLVALLPEIAVAERVCLEDQAQPGEYTVLDLRPGCRKQRAGRVVTASVSGVASFGGICPNTVLTGSCVGNDAGIFLQLIGHPDGAFSPPCVKSQLRVSGQSFAALQGSADNAPFESKDEYSVQYVRVDCRVAERAPGGTARASGSVAKRAPRAGIAAAP